MTKKKRKTKERKEPTRAEKVIAFIETLCKIPEGKSVGEPLLLEPFQKKFIYDIYDNPEGTEKAILSMARKNGKTALIACLLLVHLVGPEAKQNSQIVSGAMSREQASLVFNLACKIIKLNPELSEIIHIVPSNKRLLGKLMDTEYRALAADGATAQGLSPVLAILDEVGQVKGDRSPFIDAITFAQGAHADPLLIAISTQSATDADLLSIWIDDAKQSGDKHIVCHVYEAEKGADVLDEKAWYASNPALGKFRTYRDLQKKADEAARMPSMENAFRNYMLNQRVSTDNVFVSFDIWKECGKPPKEFGKREVYGGLDLSSKTDLTSLVLTAEDEDGNQDIMPYFWTPAEGLLDRAARDRVPYDLWVEKGFLRTTPGWTVDYDFVINEISDIIKGVNLKAVSFDRWGMVLFKQAMENQGVDLPLVEFGQGFKDMSPAVDLIESDILNGRLRHGMHPVLNMCMMNTVVESDPAGNRKFTKKRARGRIDGAVALVMARASKTKVERVEKSVYEERGVRRL